MEASINLCGAFDIVGRCSGLVGNVPNSFLAANREDSVPPFS